MNFRRGRNREEPEINLIAMIDVLLVILIFLMVTTSYAKFSELQIKGPKKYDAIQIAFDVPRETLFARLDHRVLQMIEEGLVEEVRALMDRGVDTWSQALSGIGYREVVQFLQGEINEQAMVAAIQKSTRALAKRQLTWFRRDSSVHWIRSEEEGMRLVKEFLEDE